MTVPAETPPVPAPASGSLPAGEAAPGGAWDRVLGFRLRPYQAEVLERFREGRAQGERVFHFVAPPVSGKTVGGVGLLLAGDRKGVVLSPNAAIQVQWADRFEESTGRVAEGPGATEARFSLEPDGEAPFLSLTYQTMTVKRAGSDELHGNARRLHDRLVDEGYSTLVLDECHHLTGHWGRVVRDLLERMEGPVVVGFTATPPVDREASARETYLDVVGPITHQIPLPAIVKEGLLAPYQDLVYFTRPEERELARVLAGEERHRALVEELEALEPPLTPPSVWAERVLDRSEIDGRILPFDEWLRDDPDQAIAMVRYVRARGLDPPASVVWLDEMDEEPEVEDLAEVLEAWLQHHLLPEVGEGHALVERAVETMRELGFRWSGRCFQPASVGAARKLLFSRSKLEGMRRILKAEQAWMMEDLRALVLTDYELGRKEGDEFTAIDVMGLLTSDEELDTLDPILVTGRSVLVDDDLLLEFRARAEAFLERRGLAVELSATREHGYYRIEGAGRDWATTTYVALVTELLEQGVTRCLVGTRALLGEGWDSLSLNTLVDLTAVASFVSVNQIRGRTIRQNPRDPTKCADNWDVVAVVPGVGHGLHDLTRLERKHEQFYGVSDDGVIEKGLGHVHPWLSRGGHRELGSRLDELNEGMLARARQRLDVAARWKVGEPYRGTDVSCLELEVGARERTASSPRAAPTLPAIRRVEEMRLVVSEGEKRREAWLGWWFLLLPVLLWLGDRLWRSRRLERLRAEGDEGTDMNGTLLAYAAAVREALQEAKLLDARFTEADVELRAREGGRFRLVLQGADEVESELFTEAVWELLGPVQDHRYVVERRAPGRDPAELTWELLTAEEPALEVVGVHPVPSALGRRRELAQCFGRAWNRRVAPGQLHYARRGEGKEIARQWFRRRAMELRREKKKVFA